MSKRILSFALAVIMLCSLFAFSATALSTGEIGYIVETTAVPGQKDGTVTVNVYWDFPTSVNFSTYRHNLSQVTLFYNGAKYEYDSYSWGPDFADYVKEPALAVSTSSSGIYKSCMSSMTTADQSHGWTHAVNANMAYDTDKTTAVTGNTGFPLDPANKGLMVTLTFNVLAELTEDDVIGIADASITKTKTTAAYAENGKKVSYAKESISLEKAIAAPQVAYKVFDGAVKIRKNAADNTKYDLGFTGSFEDFDPDFNDKGTSASIKSVGCEVTINGKTNTYYDRFIYEGTSYGTYAFRVAVGAFAPDDTTEVSIRMFVELNEAVDGETIFYSKGVTTTMAEQIAARAA